MSHESASAKQLVPQEPAAVRGYALKSAQPRRGLVDARVLMKPSRFLDELPTRPHPPYEKWAIEVEGAPPRLPEQRAVLAATTSAAQPYGRRLARASVATCNPPLPRPARARRPGRFIFELYGLSGEVGPAQEAEATPSGATVRYQVRW